MEKKIYVAPAIEIYEVAVEQGFAASQGADNTPWGDGGSF